jgi:hypothetical protein
MRAPASILCSYCGRPVDQKVYGLIHRDGYLVGPNVPLCEACGLEESLTMNVIWDRIAHPSDHPDAYRRIDMPRGKRADHQPVSTVTVVCDSCSLEKTFSEGGILPKDWYDDDGNLMCPNCRLPMHPKGERAVARAEGAFAQAQQQLGRDSEDVPRAETFETLSKRLEEIRGAWERVARARAVYEEKHEAAKNAKQHLEAEQKTFETLTGRLSTLADLPLFTQEAEQAAATTPIQEPEPAIV